MYITSERLDERTVLVVGYDHEANQKWELCAVFESLMKESKVQLVSRHWRRHDNPRKCESISSFVKEDLEAFDKVLPRFYDRAMKIFGLTPFDDSLPPEQKEFPFPDGPQK